MSTADQLKRGLIALGLTLDRDTQQRLLDYIALIEKWNRVYNLTAIREPEKMVSHHLLDSLAVAPHLHAKRLLDVGSGAGLPGIPLALAYPGTHVTLLDSNHKKAAFLKQAVMELKLKNAEVCSERVESWQAQSKFDVIISAAGGVDLREARSAIFNGANIVVVNIVKPGDVWNGISSDQPVGQIAQQFLTTIE